MQRGFSLSLLLSSQGSGGVGKKLGSRDTFSSPLKTSNWRAFICTQCSGYAICATLQVILWDLGWGGGWCFVAYEYGLLLIAWVQASIQTPPVHASIQTPPVKNLDSTTENRCWDGAQIGKFKGPLKVPFKKILGMVSQQNAFGKDIWVAEFQIHYGGFCWSRVGFLMLHGVSECLELYSVAFLCGAQSIP